MSPLRGLAVLLALTLALDRQTVTGPGGLLTPSTALGVRLVERLREAGMTFRAEA